MSQVESIHPCHWQLGGRGQLAELCGADLRFTPEEAVQFLNGTMGLVLSPQDVEALEARTEGWAAGLQLAALALRGGADHERFLRDFTGGPRLHRPGDEDLNSASARR